MSLLANLANVSQDSIRPTLLKSIQGGRLINVDQIKFATITQTQNLLRDDAIKLAIGIMRAAGLSAVMIAYKTSGSASHVRIVHKPTIFKNKLDDNGCHPQCLSANNEETEYCILLHQKLV